MLGAQMAIFPARARATVKLADRGSHRLEQRNGTERPVSVAPFERINVGSWPKAADCSRHVPPLGVRLAVAFAQAVARSVFPQPVRQLDPQPSDSLGVQLADSRFSHVQDRANLAHIHVLLVIHAHDLLLTLG